jgi:cellulose synthase/poly-beta-1,6-N-acetylglucosamine synthase-like glycosyltransferase
VASTSPSTSSSAELEAAIVTLLGIVLALVAGVVFVPALVFFVECALALLPGDGRGVSTRGVARPSFVVLVPAHDESAVIRATLEDLLPHLSDRDRIVVIADNCTDDTAAIARECGAEVIERSDPDHRGKGYALSFGVAHLAVNPPDVVIVVDADCHVQAGTLGELATLAIASDRPVQAEYLFRPPRQASAGAVISALAVLVRNRVRPRGLARIGLPCHLGGTGMAFPWAVIRKAPPTESYLVEDLLMGIELSILGHPPLLAWEVQVVSVLPEKQSAAMGQRRRWEHGQLTTLLQQAPRLLGVGLRTRRPQLVAMALDLAVPPLALLVLSTFALFGAAFVVGWLGGPWTAFRIACAALGCITAGVLGAWAVYGRPAIPLRALLAVPLYVAWKIPIYLGYLVRRRQKTWERTERDSSAERDEPPG